MYIELPEHRKAGEYAREHDYVCYRGYAIDRDHDATGWWIWLDGEILDDAPTVEAACHLIDQMIVPDVADCGAGECSTCGETLALYTVDGDAEWRCHSCLVDAWIHGCIATPEQISALNDALTALGRARK